MMLHRNFNLLPFLILFLFLNQQCKEDIPIPKPKSFLKINFPNKEYHKIESECPFSFNIPNYSSWEKIFPTAPKCDEAVIFPKFKAELICKYYELDSNLYELEEKIFSSIESHKKFADNGILKKAIQNQEKKIYGLTFEITGNSAVNYKFYLTDQSKHFFTGELLFRVKPNYDSLKPIIKFIEKDIDEMISSFEWK